MRLDSKPAASTTGAATPRPPSLDTEPNRAYHRIYGDPFGLPFPAHSGIGISVGAGSSVKTSDHPALRPFTASVCYVEQNLHARGLGVVGDRAVGGSEFTIQLRSIGAANAGSKLGVATQVALYGAILDELARGGLTVVGRINLDGSIEPVYSAVSIVEPAVEKQAKAVRMPVVSRRQLSEPSNDMAIEDDVQLFLHGRDVLPKPVLE